MVEQKHLLTKPMAKNLRRYVVMERQQFLAVMSTSTFKQQVHIHCVKGIKRDGYIVQSVDQKKYPTLKKQHVIHSVIHMPADMGGRENLMQKVASAAFIFYIDKRFKNML